MPSRSELNLIGVVWPVCLLKCNSELNRLNEGEEVDVIVQDPDILQDLLKIVERSLEYSVSTTHEKDHYRLHIRK
jgi:TusA-related sulfurtransferase